MHWSTFQYLISLLSTIVLCFLVKTRFLDNPAVFNFKYFLARTDSLCAALLSSQASRDEDDLLIGQFSILKLVTKEVREDSNRPRLLRYCLSSCPAEPVCSQEYLAPCDLYQAYFWCSPKYSHSLAQANLFVIWYLLPCHTKLCPDFIRL